LSGGIHKKEENPIIANLGSLTQKKSADGEDDLKTKASDDKNK